MSAAAQLFLLSLASAPTPSPGGLTGTSSVAITAPSPARVRVEPHDGEPKGPRSSSGLVGALATLGLLV